MEKNNDFKLIIAQMELHLEEEIQTVNEILKENIISFDNDIIMLYLNMRLLMRSYKKDLKDILKQLERRKDKE